MEIGLMTKFKYFSSVTYSSYSTKDDGEYITVKFRSGDHNQGYSRDFQFCKKGYVRASAT